MPCWGANYTITDTEDTVDGGANASGKGRCNAGYVSYAAGPYGVCTNADTIIIDGGARGDLTLKNFDGVTDYITVINEDSTRVVLTEGSGTAGILIDDCNYLDLRGDGLSSHAWTRDCRTASCYGIVVDISGNPALSMIRVQGESSNIKIQYIELDMSGKSGGNGGEQGIFVQDGSLTSSYTFDNFEIAYNYIHDTYYHGMYLGQNKPAANNDPYISNFNVHHNLLEDLGAEGGELKGVAAGTTVEFHHNIVRRTRQQCIYNCDSVLDCVGFEDPYSCCTGELTGSCDYPERGWFQIGWIFADLSANAYAVVYNNWIEETAGSCFEFRNASHVVYNNVLLGCGTGTCVGDKCVEKEAGWFHAIILKNNAISGATECLATTIYNNTIVAPLEYAIYTSNGLCMADVDDNLIINPGTGYINEPSCSCRATCIEEGAGDYANTKSMSNPGFVSFDDDGDYSDGDDFDLATGHSVDAMGDQVLTTDYNGDARVAPFDDGAYDYGVTYPLQGVAGDFKYN